jgi:hypothetical protein
MVFIQVWWVLDAGIGVVEVRFGNGRVIPQSIDGN